MNFQILAVGFVTLMLLPTQIHYFYALLLFMLLMIAIKAIPDKYAKYIFGRHPALDYEPLNMNRESVELINEKNEKGNKAPNYKLVIQYSPHILYTAGFICACDMINTINEKLITFNNNTLKFEFIRLANQSISGLNTISYILKHYKLNKPDTIITRKQYYIEDKTRPIVKGFPHQQLKNLPEKHKELQTTAYNLCDNLNFIIETIIGIEINQSKNKQEILRNIRKKIIMEDKIIAELNRDLKDISITHEI